MDNRLVLLKGGHRLMSLGTNQMDDSFAGLLILLVIVVPVLLAFFAPTIIAFYRKHHYKWIIFAINIITGVSGVGYVIALVWAIWPSRTGLADPFLNDPTSNSLEASQTIYSRYGANLRAFHSAQTNKELFVFCQNQQCGPYTVSEVRSLLLSGRFSQSDLGWYEGAADWIALSAIPEVTAGLLPPPPRFPAAT